MGREKARRDDMAKAVTMGMSAEQFEKKFGIEKPYYEARTERELSEADYLSSFGNLNKDRFKMRQKFVEEAAEKAPVAQIDLKLKRTDISEEERRTLTKKRDQLVTDYVDRQMAAVFGNVSKLSEMSPFSFQSKTGRPKVTILDNLPNQINIKLIIWYEKFNTEIMGHLISQTNIQTIR